MTKLANSDLNNKLEVKSQDELGKLAKNFNNTVEQQKKLIVRILNSVEDLSAYSEELSASAEEGNAIVEETTALRDQ